MLTGAVQRAEPQVHRVRWPSRERPADRRRLEDYTVKLIKDCSVFRDAVAGA